MNRFLPHGVRGQAMLVASVLLNGLGVYILKPALEGASPISINVASCLIAATVFLGMGLLWRLMGWRAGELHAVSPTALGSCIRTHWHWLLAPPAAVAAAGWLSNVSIQTYGAATTALLMNLILVYLVLGGLAMGERLRWSEAPAIVLTLGGVFLFCRKDDHVQWMALGIMSLACLFSAAKQITVKRLSHSSPLPVVMCAVLVASGGWSLVAALLTGSWRTPSPQALGLVTLSTISCSVMGMSLLYGAYKIVGIARGAPFDAMRPLVVLGLGLLDGGPWPTRVQWIGAVMVLSGSGLLAAIHAQNRIRNAATSSVGAEPVEEDRKSEAAGPASQDRAGMENKALARSSP